MKSPEITDPPGMPREEPGSLVRQIFEIERYIAREETARAVSIPLMKAAAEKDPRYLESIRKADERLETFKAIARTLRTLRDTAEGACYLARIKQDRLPPG